MLTLIKLYLLRDLRDHYPKLYSPLVDVFTTMIELVIYYYTAKAFGHTFKEGLAGLDYFSFVILGEMTLMLPGALFVALPRIIQFAVAEGRIGKYLNSPTTPHIPLLISSFSLVPRIFFHLILYLILGGLFFNLSFSFSFLAQAFILQLVALPIFMGLSFLGAALILRFGRGGSIMSHLHTVFAVFAGVYFPLSVLPETLQKISSVASPFTVLLEGTRNLVSENTSLLETMSPLIFWGLLSAVIGYFAFWWSIQSVRQKGLALNIAY